jgi:hypothetical protein
MLRTFGRLSDHAIPLFQLPCHFRSAARGQEKRAGAVFSTPRAKFSSRRRDTCFAARARLRSVPARSPARTRVKSDPRGEVRSLCAL